MSKSRFVVFVVATVATIINPIAVMSRSAKIDVPVIITASTDGEACGSGEIVGLDPRGDGFLSVRSGPAGAPYTEIDRLYNGDQVYICGTKGPWRAVVYMPGRVLSASCGVSKPWSTDQAYTGPCRSGGIHTRYLKPTAG